MLFFDILTAAKAYLKGHLYYLLMEYNPILMGRNPLIRYFAANLQLFFETAKYRVRKTLFS